MPNFQNKLKYIFGHNKQNVPITSTFGLIKNLSNSSYNLKSVQISWLCILSFSFAFFSRLLAVKILMTKFLNAKMSQITPIMVEEIQIP